MDSKEYSAIVVVVCLFLMVILISGALIKNIIDPVPDNPTAMVSDSAVPDTPAEAAGDENLPPMSIEAPEPADEYVPDMPSGEAD